jgi:hypothetical protein
MSEYKEISGFLEFASHKHIMALVIALKASEHILEDDDCYFFLDERGHVIDSGDETGVIDIESMTIEFPSNTYRNLSSRLMGLINEYKPKGELKIVCEESAQVFVYLDGHSLMESDKVTISAYLDRSEMSPSDMCEHIEQSFLCLTNNYEKFEQESFGDADLFNTLRTSLLAHAASTMIGQLRIGQASAA